MDKASSTIKYGPAEPFIEAAQGDKDGWAGCGPEIYRSKIMNFAESAEFLNLSPATFERLVATRIGPPVVKLSARRRGCRIGDLIDWIETRVSTGKD